MFTLTTETVIAFIGIYLTILGSVWGLGRSLDGRFAKVLEKIETVKDQILSKLEYHERHDDKRFSEVREDLSEMRIKNAVLDARVGKVLDQETIQIPTERRAQRAS